jgi:hypothetical protein
MIPALADPSGPPDTRPPTRPGTPAPPPPKIDALAEISGLLLRALALVGTLPAVTDRVEVCGQEIARHRIRMSRQAIQDLQHYTQTPARQHLSSAAAVAGGSVISGRDGKDTALPRAAVASRPVRPRAGEPPLPGADFRLPPVPPYRAFMAAALARRAD